MSFTESLRQSRLTVVSVDASSGRIRVRGEAEACTELACAEETLVVSDEGTSADLGTLNPGDTVKVDVVAGRAPRIVVLRRAWDELTSPEL